MVDVEVQKMVVVLGELITTREMFSWVSVWKRWEFNLDQALMIVNHNGR